MKEFWNEAVTKASWGRLTWLAGRFDFILIGGWAAYLWTKTHKSKDIDIIVDYGVLDELRRSYPLVKNERLRKYEIRQDSFDIDVYVPHYSRLALPVEILSKHTRRVEGIRTVIPEILVILKQGAEMERRGSMKGTKDRIDILALLIYSGFGLKKYRALLKEFRLEHFEKELRRNLEEFDPDDAAFLGFNHQEFVKWKRKFLEELRS